MAEINYKHDEYKLPFSANEKHSPEEFDPKHDAALNNPESRHRDKLIDDICDTHPGSPMCKVFDEWFYEATSSCWSDLIQSSAKLE